MQGFHLEQYEITYDRLVSNADFVQETTVDNW